MKGNIAIDSQIQNNVLRECHVTTRDPEEILEALLDGLADTILEASDEDIFEEFRAQGYDPLKEAQEVRELLLKTIKTATKVERK